MILVERIARQESFFQFVLLQLEMALFEVELLCETLLDCSKQLQLLSEAFLRLSGEAGNLVVKRVHLAQNRDLPFRRNPLKKFLLHYLRAEVEILAYLIGSFQKEEQLAPQS